MKKRVLVTGGAKGIGKALVEALASKDYKVVATYSGSKESAEKLNKKYQNVSFYQVDLTDRSALNTFITEIMNSKPFDVLINNAGIWLGKPFEKMSETELFEQIDLNFAAPARLTHGLLPNLKQAKAPLVINISSQAAQPVFPGEAMYSATKSALSTLSQVLRAELNPVGVRVLTVEPWGVNTYGLPEPSGLVPPEDLANIILQAIETPDYIQLEKVGISHVQQSRGSYPDWIET